MGDAEAVVEPPVEDHHTIKSNQFMGDAIRLSNQVHQPNNHYYIHHIYH